MSIQQFQTTKIGGPFALVTVPTPKPGLSYREIGLEECVLRVQLLAELLVRVLRNGASNLRLLTIDWNDDFQDDSWQMKASVLYPFGSLSGVELRLGGLRVAQSEAATVRRNLTETLEGLCM